MLNEFKVKKRNGDLQNLNIDKIHDQVLRCCEGIDFVSPSLIEINASIQFYDGISTFDIDQMLLKSSVDLINPNNNPDGHINYQYVAGRILNSILRKQVYKQYKPLRLFDIINKNIELGYYTEELLQWYSQEEWDILDSYLDHNKDENFSYSALKQFIDKYLVKDRLNDNIYETPQIRYIIGAATLFHSELNSKIRINKVVDYYNNASNKKFTLATPVLSGLGTPTKQFSSCVVIKAGDSLDSIYSAGHMIGRYAAKRAGIGLDVGALRGAGTSVRSGQIKHTGLVPFIQKWHKDLKCISQGGLRDSSCTVFYPFFHMDFESLIVLKNNQGTEETRCRGLDYGVVLHGYIFKLLKEKKSIYLFNPQEVPDLYKAFYTDPELFVELYDKYSKSRSLKVKKKINSEKYFYNMLLKERRDTGRIYLMFIDNVIKQGPYNPKKGDVIYSGNLCMEIMIPTKEFESVNDDSGLIGLCTLSSINWNAINSPKELEIPCKLAVESLTNILEYQDFLSIHSNNHNNNYRPLGIGITGLAAWCAKRNYKYGSKEMLNELKVWLEHQTYYCIQHSIELAKTKGICNRWYYTKYAEGMFPWETRKELNNNLVDYTPVLDWEILREDMLEYGMHHTTLFAIAPCESSSLVLDTTNGIELPMSLISTKESKSGSLTQVVTGYSEYSDQYELMWSQNNCRNYLKVAAIIASYTDQAVSINQFYNLGNYKDQKDGKIPMEEYINDIIFAYNHSIKTLYYDLTYDPKIDINSIKENDCENCKL